MVVRLRRFALAAAALALLAGSSAEANSISGLLNDSGNSALVWRDLGLPSFVNDAEIAENVALYEFTVTTAGTFDFVSAGYLAGGAEPYFSIFSGSGNSATFLASNFFDPLIDFSVAQFLDIGTYILAVGVWENMSLAENHGGGTLGEGFSGLGDPTRLGSSYYEIAFSSLAAAGSITDSGAGVLDPAPTPVPEPASVLLLCTGLPVLRAVIRRRRH